ncbi:hypothetical protein [Rothia koreensis]|uniref:hypothetical protein n=1 Tax=Rothia koreensis TaxID=592378 RepID=UPI003FCC8B42
MKTARRETHPIDIVAGKQRKTSLAQYVVYRARLAFYLLVPKVGLEPTLREEPHFECSRGGFRGVDYRPKPLQNQGFYLPLFTRVHAA